jgi:isoleucyl-tRNA synthetase
VVVTDEACQELLVAHRHLQSLSWLDNWMMGCREMVVVHPDVNFLDDITGQLGEYVREELNVRGIVPCNDPLKYASLRAEPDYSSLGKRLGKAMGLVAKEVKSMTQTQIMDFERAGKAKFAGHELELQDIKV